MARITGTDLRRYHDTAASLARDAGAVLRRGFRTAMQVRLKSRIDPVTEFDLKSEKLIVDTLKKKYPTHSIQTEESKLHLSDGDSLRWIVDPLDGTVNYAHGLPVYCVSIGLQFDGDIICGAVYDPERDELFSAVIGQGSFCNRERLAVSKVDKLRSALIATGFAYDIGTAKRNNLGLFARVAKKVQGVRRPGSAAIDLCWLASGRIDAYWELKLHPWDVAAGTLIVTEAGGALSGVNGKPYRMTQPDLLATNGNLHNQMIRTLAGS